MVFYEIIFHTLINLIISSYIYHYLHRETIFMNVASKNISRPASILSLVSIVSHVIMLLWWGFHVICAYLDSLTYSFTSSSIPVFLDIITYCVRKDVLITFCVSFHVSLNIFNTFMCILQLKIRLCYHWCHERFMFLIITIQLSLF